MADYARICSGLNDRGTLVKIENLPEVYKNINRDEDHYTSVFYFNEDHYKTFKTKGTIAGITDVWGNKLLFDIDSEKDLELARKDAVTVYKRLVKYGFSDENISIFFSGNKGYEISVQLKTKLTPNQTKNICLNIAKGLSTVDPKVYNATRILRMPLTRHQKTGLYKTPLTADELQTLTVEQIKEIAKQPMKYEDIENAWTAANLPKELEEMKNSIPEVKLNVEAVLERDMDLSKLDRNIPEGFDIVRWALLNGYFSNGERSTALIYLAAYLKNKKFDLEHTYRMLKGTCELQAKRTGETRFPDNELYNNVIKQVYGEHWKGGMGSLTDPNSWLHMYAKSTGLYEELSTTLKDDILSISQAFNLFKTFAANIDKNRLTFGIKELDENLDALVGRTYILGGSPGSGKTSLALQILNNTSLNNTQSVFFSFDMSTEDVLQKLIQKHFKLTAKEVYNQANTIPGRAEEFAQTIAENYKNVHLIRSSGMTIEAMRNRIAQIEKTFGEVRLVVVDYLDLVQADFSDPTQKSMAVIQGLKSIGTDMRKCMLILSQPNKANQKINEPVSTYAAIKGSSAIGELANSVLWIHRPGASARGFENDKYYSIDCLKNRHGAMFNLDFAWEGISGTISTLTPVQKMQLEKLREDLKEAKDADDSF